MLPEVDGWHGAATIEEVRPRADGGWELAASTYGTVVFGEGTPQATEVTSESTDLFLLTVDLANLR